MTTSQYNFNDYFPHQRLDKVIGAPTTKSLQTVFRQLRRNARSVNTNLGGGQYGHLFLVLSEDEWNALPDTIPIVEPEEPGPMNMQGVRQSTAAVVIQQKQQEDLKRKYERYQALKRTLKNQLIEAFDSVYLDPIRCDQTDMITTNISETMKFLKETYGEMTVDELEEENTNIKQYPFDPTQSIDLLLTKVQTHAEICNIAGAPLTDKQIIDLAYLIINKTPTYKQYLIEWNKKPLPKNWSDFKLLMRKAYSDLRKVKGLTIKDSSLHATEMVTELKNHQTELVQEVENRCNEKLVEMINYTASNNEMINHTDDMNNEQAFNVTQEINTLKNQLQSLTQQLQQFQNTISNQDKNVRFSPNTKTNSNTSWQQPNNNITANNPSRFYNNKSNNNHFQSYKNYNNNKVSQFNRFNSRKYCWTHGACSHDGTECQTPAVGHQPFATFRNRLNGNNAGCIIRRGRRFNRVQN